MASPLRCIFRLKSEIQHLDLLKCTRYDILRYQSGKPADAVKEEPEGEFRVLRLFPEAKKVEKRVARRELRKPPRTLKMAFDQDWTNVWPGPRTFHPAVVPLPVRMGCNKKGAPPSKNANTELMKIPNFLHLTPAAIKKHCEALKQFCTEWPKELQTDMDIEKHFPLEVIDSDYCHSSPSIRDPQARIISIRIKLKNLDLDKHAKDKFLRLVGERYDPKTDYVTITTDSCPLKKQNYDYAHYLLTATYFEAWKYEDWENLKSDDDMEKYIFKQRQSYKNICKLFEYNNRSLPDLNKFGKAVEDWHNKGDQKEIIERYKKEAIKLLSLTPVETAS